MREEVGQTPFATIFEGFPSRIPALSNPNNLTFAPRENTSAIVVDCGEECIVTASEVGDFVFGDEIVRVLNQTVLLDTPSILEDTFMTQKSVENADRVYMAWKKLGDDDCTLSRGSSGLEGVSDGAWCGAMSESPFVSPYSAPVVVEAHVKSFSGQFALSLHASTWKRVGVVPNPSPFPSNISVVLDSKDGGTMQLFASNVENGPFHPFSPLRSLPQGAEDGVTVRLEVAANNATAFASVDGGEKAVVNVTGWHHSDIGNWGDRSGDARVGVLVGGDGGRMMVDWFEGKMDVGAAPHLKPAVVGPAVDGAVVFSQPLGREHEEDCRRGVLDTSKPPFLVTDYPSPNPKWNTFAFQQAVWYAGERGLAIVIPPNTTISLIDTIHFIQRGRLGRGAMVNPEQGPHVGGSTRPNAIRVFGIPNATLPRPILYLPPSTPGFMDAANPKILLQWQRQFQDMPLSASKDNSEMNAAVSGLDVVIGDGNKGAIALHLRGAQGGVVEDVRIDLGMDGLVGLHAISGSGGAHASVTITGGMWGADLRFGQPAPTLTAANFINNKCGAFVYAAPAGLSVVGSNITLPPNRIDASIPPIASGCQPLPWLNASHRCYLSPSPVPSGYAPCHDGDASRITLIDSILTSPTPSTSPVMATIAPSSMVNTYIHGQFSTLLTAYNVSTSTSHTPIATVPFPPIKSNEWLHVSSLDVSTTPAPHSDSNGSEHRVFYFDASSSINLTPLPTVYLNATPTTTPPPSSLLSKHSIGFTSTFPSLATPNIADLGRMGGDPTGIEDTASLLESLCNTHDVVFIPRGCFRISRTVTIASRCSIIGIDRVRSNILFHPNQSSPTPPAPSPALLVTPALPPTPTTPNPAPRVLAWFQILIAFEVEAQVFGLQWQFAASSGNRNSVYRGTHAKWADTCGYLNASYCPSRDGTVDFPMFVFEGVGEGRGGGEIAFYVLDIDMTPMHSAPGFRMLRVQNLHTPLSFYQLNTEHALGDANTEITNSSLVTIYSLKSEGRYNVLWLHNSTSITLTSYGGNACPFTPSKGYPAPYANFTPSIVRITGNSNDISIRSFQPYATMGTLSTPPLLHGAVPCAWPSQWIPILLDTTEHQLTTKPLQYPQRFSI